VLYFDERAMAEVMRLLHAVRHAFFVWGS
jgi:hypothetical protein